MELKTKYQYTYFVYPFIIKENKYQKYMLKMLKDKNCKLKIFQKEKDINMYKYFLPKLREFLFSSSSFTNLKMKKFEELPLETRAAVLSRYNCTMFEYKLEKDIQGKIDESKGIFFNIQKIQVICFNTGICFLCIKTNIEENANFLNILNFNYKFRDITQESNMLNNYDNIRLQTDSFSDVENFKEFIKKITGSNIEAMKLNLDTERFLTYSYVCIDQEAWNNNCGFENIQNNFIKYASILPADNSRDFGKDKLITISKWKYAKLGLSKLGMMLFSSSSDMNNYTILPDEYENQYFYTYIFNLYEKIYLKQLHLEFNDKTKIKATRKKFIDFTKKLWIQELTDDEIGTVINQKLREVFELEELYAEVKNKYDVLYKELNIEKNSKSNIVIVLILIASLIFNVLNFVALINR